MAPDTYHQPVKRLSDLAAEARFVRLALYSRRSDRMVRLLDYLVECTIGGITPHRNDIAHVLYDRAVFDSAGHDAARVYVHRLRKKLDELYRDKPGPRLRIPRGEYRIILANDRANAPAHVRAYGLPRRLYAAAARKKWRVAGAMLLAINIVTWDGFRPGESYDRHISQLADSPLWQPLAMSKRPTTVVFGDHYLFVDAPDPHKRRPRTPRLILDPSITSRNDLDLFLIQHPNYAWQWGTENPTYVPVDTITALQDVLAAMRGLGKDCCGQTDIISASRLTPDILKISNIVYVGLLSDLSPILRNPLFQASGFRAGGHYAQLIDIATARPYGSGEAVVPDGSAPQKSYGYIASLPGPSDNRLVIIAGTDGRALRRMGQTVNAPKPRTYRKGRGKGASRAFELLYQVNSANDIQLGEALLIERPLRSGGIWDNAMPGQ